MRHLTRCAWLVVLVVVASACGLVPPPVVAPPSSPPALDYCAVVVGVYEGDPALDAKIVSARAVLSLIDGRQLEQLTDGAGNASFGPVPSGRYRLDVSASGYVGAGQEIGCGVTAVSVQRMANPQPLPTVRVSVTTPAGPLPGALVTLDGAPPVTTDASGLATFPAVGPGPRHVWVTAAGHKPTDAHLEIPDTGSLDVQISLVPIPPAPTWRPIRGRARLSGRAFVDDDGPRPALGASFFWLAWGYRHDRARAEANLRWLAERGVDYVRALGEVGGSGWSDRIIDPAWPDYVNVIRGATELANRYGLRVQWTLFGGGSSQTEEQWWAATRRAVDALRPVVTGVQLVEIQNEQQGPPPALTRELAAYVRRELGVEVALAGTPEKELPSLYAGSAATLGTVHFDRVDGDWGWRFARQSWGYWELPNMPPAFTNNEPAGIQGSVRAENDPVKLASDALVTWIAGGAAYVIHHGAGIYGRDYTHATAGHRMANAWEQPELEQALAIIANVRSVLPGDIANWQRANNHWTAPNPVPPFRFTDLLGDAATRDRGLTRSFTALRSAEFVTVVLGARGDLVTTPTRSVTATVRELRTWTEQPWAGRLVGSGSTYLVIGR